jgi:S-adenosylmethionine:tRNA ribosyltransferase-isomerase
MLVSAFGGTEFVRQAYEEAVRTQYRFYTYGDAMLLTDREAPAGDD